MTRFVAALPMYDWPEARAETDAQWARLRGWFLNQGIDAPEHLVRCNADLPPVPGGIRTADGRLLAPDPTTLAPDELDLYALWLHPALLVAQSCWGPLELSLAEHVRVVGHPSYDGFEGGRGEFYSSAIAMRAGEGRPPPADGKPIIPLDILRGGRLAFNSPDSMSGILALERDLKAAGESLDMFSERIATGTHRASIAAVADGRADVCAIDCRTWALARRFHKASAGVAVVGWTGFRKGLPFIASLKAPRFEVPDTF
jgi:ABC-type phosphate/phosphonate transport system substrate-binding protein